VAVLSACPLRVAFLWPRTQLVSRRIGSSKQLFVCSPCTNLRQAVTLYAVVLDDSVSGGGHGLAAHCTGSSQRTLFTHLVAVHAHSTPHCQCILAPVGCRCSSLASLLVGASHYPGVNFDVGADQDGDRPFDRPRHFMARFQGRGTTPAERCAHLQRQLAALPGCSDFLAPASWPSCSCLEGVSLLLLEPTARQPMMAPLVAALQTTSLLRLRVITGMTVEGAGADMLHLHRMSTLTSLTCLQLWSVRAPIPAPVLAAVACLQDLVTLDLGTTVEITPDLCRWAIAAAPLLVVCCPTPPPPRSAELVLRARLHQHSNTFG
jgi:hypothetical protein